MPTCHRCTRTFASSEVRRTTKGHVCKDSTMCKRRLSQTKHYVVDGLIVDDLMRHANRVNECADTYDPIAALNAISLLMEDIQQAAADIIERAAEETTLTQKQLASALGVPASTLRGLRG